MKHLPPSSLRHTQDHHHARYFVEQPEDHTFEDLFVSTYWGHHRNLKQHDLVRVRHKNGDYDVMLNVVTTAQGGVKVELWPKLPDPAVMHNAPAPEQTLKRIVAGKPVPRVEWNKATKWRVIGLDGNEHSRAYNTRSEAETAMLAYAKSIGIDVEIATQDAA